MHQKQRPAATAQHAEIGRSDDSALIDFPSSFACTRDPDRWTTRPDDGAKALCRSCPRRWLCAQDACRTPGAEGVWAGIRIPEAGRARQFALKQLRSLAEHNGFPIRTTPQESADVA
jgi:WhiB family redox-sensing transcriptional regulator